MAAFRFGVDSFIWTEVFRKKTFGFCPRQRNWALTSWIWQSPIRKAFPWKRCWKQNADGTGIGDHHYIGAGYQSDFSG